MKFASKSFALASTLALAGLSMTPAIASAAEQERSASVTYTDLDLSTEEGLAILDQRIDNAARQVCELDRTDTGTRIRNRDARACYDQAKRSFEEQIASLVPDAQLGG